MARNVGPEDRVVRIVVGLGLAVLAYLQVLPPNPTNDHNQHPPKHDQTRQIAWCLLYKVADIDTSIQEQPYSSTDDRAGL
jgi:hypothetical protein